ncbi:MAG: hypothetical protein HY897_24610 [Deltaproteobacteria bacterium]|nr:hypothetical protein [Deltaproteobacteria bacterium]
MSRGVAAGITALAVFCVQGGYAHSGYSKSGTRHVWDDAKIKAVMDSAMGGAMVELWRKGAGVQFLAGDGYHYLGSLYGGDGVGNNTFDQSWEQNAQVTIQENTASRLVIAFSGALRLTEAARRSVGLRFSRTYTFEKDSSRIAVSHLITVDTAEMDAIGLDEHRVMMLSCPVDVLGVDAGLLNFAWDTREWWYGCCNSWEHHTASGVTAGPIPDRRPGQANSGIMVVPGVGQSGLQNSWYDIWGPNGGIGRVVSSSQVATFNFWRNVEVIDPVRTIEFFFVNRDREPIDGSYHPPVFTNGQTLSATEVLYVHAGDWQAFFAEYMGSQTEDAAVESHTIPVYMTPGSTVRVEVAMKNTGTVAWQEPQDHIGGTRLGSVQDNTVMWANGTAGGYHNSAADQRLYMAAPVAPGQTNKFTFDLVAPASPGTARFSARMVHDGVAWFGQTLSRDISVTTQIPDAGQPDTGTADAGTFDSGAGLDAGPVDTGAADSGVPDAGPAPDAGFDDAGPPVDGAAPDSGSEADAQVAADNGGPDVPAPADGGGGAVEDQGSGEAPDVGSGNDESSGCSCSAVR